jgi:hypothetical protein
MISEVSPEGNLNPNNINTPPIPALVNTNKGLTQPLEQKKRERKKVGAHTYSAIIGHANGKRDDSYGPEDYS